MQFQLRFPERIVFGCGAFSQLGELCAGLGRRALLVTGKSALRKSGKLEQGITLLKDRGARVETFEGVENEPSLATCQRGIKRAREIGADLVVAIGGGSTLDTGKTIAAIAPQPGHLPEYFAGERKMESRSLPSSRFTIMTKERMQTSGLANLEVVPMGDGSMPEGR